MSRKLSFFTNIALSIALSASVLACSDSDDATPSDGVDAGSDAAVECVLQGDGTCPEGCVSLTGTPLDADNHCWRDEVILDCEDQERSGRPDAIGCYVHVESGTLYTTPDLVFWSGNDEYRACDSDENWLMYDTRGKCSDGPGLDCKLLDDGTCPEGCEPQKGYRFDDESQCLEDEEILSCVVNVGFDDAIGCYVHLETGAKYWTPSLYYRSMAGFRTCTEDEKPEGFDTATPCE